MRYRLAYQSACQIDQIFTVSRLFNVRPQKRKYCSTSNKNVPQYSQVLNIVAIQRLSSHDVTAALLVSQNKETAAMLVFLRDGKVMGAGEGNFRATGIFFRYQIPWNFFRS